MPAHRPSPDDVPTLTVPSQEAGTTLLEFLSARFITHSKAALRRLITSGGVRANGAACSTGRTLWQGDVVTLPPGTRPGRLPEQSVAIDVVHEDEDLLCINKPAGLPVLPGRRGEGGELHRSLLAHLNPSAPPGGPYVRPHLVHRLDRGTSGVLLVAKTVDAGRALGRQFQWRHVDKAYLALVEGVFPREAMPLDIPIARLPGDVLRMVPDARHGRPATTEVQVFERFGHFTLLRAHPLTGRQHQIRVHLSAAGYPLAVDDLYGRRDELSDAHLRAVIGPAAGTKGTMLMARCPLHAESIAYRHPSTGAAMRHEAPLPEDMRALLELLRSADPPR